jgi:hypothetical protein
METVSFGISPPPGDPCFILLFRPISFAWISLDFFTGHSPFAPAGPFKKKSPQFGLFRCIWVYLTASDPEVPAQTPAGQQRQWRFSQTWRTPRDCSRRPF